MVKVPKEVLKGLDFVRESGKTNMIDFNMVQRIAFDNNFYATVTWLQENKDLYSKGVFEGFEAEEV